MGCININLCKVVCSLGTNIRGKIGKYMGTVTCLVSPLNYSRSRIDLCVLYHRGNRSGGLIFIICEATVHVLFPNNLQWTAAQR